MNSSTHEISDIRQHLSVHKWNMVRAQVFHTVGLRINETRRAQAVLRVTLFSVLVLVAAAVYTIALLLA